MENLLGVIIIILVIIIAKFGNTISKLNEELAENSEKLAEILRQQKSEKISKAVRKGQNVEKVIPFFENFPHYGKQIVNCYQPVDYIVFDKDEIIVVELKTGKSQLSPKQKKIKKMIEDGKVRFELIRVSDEGVFVK